MKEKKKKKKKKKKKTECPPHCEIADKVNLNDESHSTALLLLSTRSLTNSGFERP